MKATCYLVLRAEQIGGRVSGFKVTRATQGLPGIEAGEARVKVIVEADPGIFDAESVALLVEPRSVALAAAVIGAGDE